MHTKTLQQLTLSDLAAVHLDINGGRVALADGHIMSNIGGLITEITQSRGLQNLRIFSPLFGSFALLDQIGSCYINKTISPYPDTNASGIKKALYYFCGMTPNSVDMKALYGLRNSLMHDGSILSRGQPQANGTWSGPFYHFILGSKSNPIVEHPSVAWDGNLHNLRPAHRTKINQRALTDLAIGAVQSAKQLLEHGDLDFSLKGGEVELYYRYLFHTP